MNDAATIVRLNARIHSQRLQISHLHFVVRQLKAKLASVDTHPEGGDVQQAPSLMGSAVPQADAQTKSVNP
jgi:hypothetical protein